MMIFNKKSLIFLAVLSHKFVFLKNYFQSTFFTLLCLLVLKPDPDPDPQKFENGSRSKTPDPTRPGSETVMGGRNKQTICM